MVLSFIGAPVDIVKVEVSATTTHSAAQESNSRYRQIFSFQEISEGV